MTFEYMPKFNVRQSEPSVYKLGETFMNQIDYMEPPVLRPNSFITDNTKRETDTEKYPFTANYTSIYMINKYAGNDDSNIDNLLKRLLSNAELELLIESKR